MLKHSNVLKHNAGKTSKYLQLSIYLIINAHTSNFDFEEN